MTTTGTFTVNPPFGCFAGVTWTASSNVPWLTLTGGATGNAGSAVISTFNALSNPKSGQRTATIIITPNAGNPSVIQFTQAGSTAPLLNREVTALYQSILGRDPDSAGYAYWTGSGAPSDGAALGQMADSFLTSVEAFNSGFAVMSAWQAATGAPPTFAEYTNSVINVRTGYQTIPGLFSTLAANTNPSFSATNLYQNLLNRPPLSSEVASYESDPATAFQTLIGYPSNTTPSAAPDNEFQSTGIFADHQSAVGDHTNGLYIRLLYYVTLGRDPDPGGLNFWTGIANTGGAGILFQGAATFELRLQIAGPAASQGFTGSPEFQALYQ